VRLQDQLEAAANLLFADCTDSHNLFECSGYAFLKSKKNRKLVAIINTKWLAFFFKLKPNDWK
jgi:hypothetical protein